MEDDRRSGDGDTGQARDELEDLELVGCVLVRLAFAPAMMLRAAPNAM